jgi:hypothetical protein
MHGQLQRIALQDGWLITTLEPLAAAPAPPITKLPCASA